MAGTPATAASTPEVQLLCTTQSAARSHGVSGPS